MKNFFIRRKATAPPEVSDNSSARAPNTPNTVPPAPARLPTQRTDEARLSGPLTTQNPAPAGRPTRPSHRAPTSAGLALEFSKHRSHSQTGVFHGLNVRFETPTGEPISAEMQAHSILKTAKALIEDGGAPGVAITCSTNTRETSGVHERYATGHWDATLREGNQGKVVAEMEKLQQRDPEYAALRGKVRIAPISTVDGNSRPLAKDMFDAVILNDLERIKTDYLEKGWVVLGWKNQITSSDASHPYAVGGGQGKNSRRAIGESQSSLIQERLIQYSQNFAMQSKEPQAASVAQRNIVASSSGTPSVRLTQRITGLPDIDSAWQPDWNSRPMPPATAATTPTTASIAANTAPSIPNSAGGSPAPQLVLRHPNPAALARLVAKHRTHTDAGLFHGFNLPFTDASGATIKSRTQAKSILEMAKALIEDGQVPGVAITYSANTLQTKTIRESYAAGVWRTETNGENQAAVIYEMEKLQQKPEHAALRGKVRIAPISTIDYNSPPLRPAEFDGVLSNDLSRIKTDYLDNGWVVLGWQNQLTADDKQHPYAVGGGVARNASNAISNEQSNRVQAALVQYSQSFALHSGAPG